MDVLVRNQGNQRNEKTKAETGRLWKYIYKPRNNLHGRKLRKEKENFIRRFVTDLTPVHTYVFRILT